MASGATFHAKITADARQFVQQVEESTQALAGLVKATEKMSKTDVGKSAARGSLSKAKGEIKSAYDEAQAKARQAHQQTLSFIAAENAARAKGKGGTPALDATRMNLRGFADEVKSERELRRQYSKIAQREELLKQKQERQKILSIQRQQEHLERQQLDAMVTGRYALYDMANAYAQIARNAFQITKALASSVAVAGEFETAFTAVERAAVLDEGTRAFDHMRQSLIDLSTEIPVTFDQITEIATLGAQMGVAAADINGFTKTVSSFAAVTGTTIDETAEKFGRISALADVPVSEFENLASSVLYAGFNAVATEAEILSMSESIAAAAANAGYSAKQIIGLSTALSSLGIAPEQARGVILRVFNTITRAIEGSSDKLNDFAAAAGMSAQQAQYLWKNSPEQFFTSLLNGLGSVENLTLALDQLGITNTREINVIQRLSGNMDVYSKSLEEAARAYEENSALSDAYGKTADNLDAKIQRLQSSFEALQAAAGEGLAGAIKPVIELLIEAANAAAEFAKSDIGKFVLPVVTGFAAITAAFAGFRFVTSIATAQMLAMRTALLKMSQMGSLAANPIRNLITTMTEEIFVTDKLSGRKQFLTRAQIEQAASAGLLDQKTKQLILTEEKASVATRGLSIAMRGLGLAMGAISAISLVAMFAEMAASAREFGKEVGGISSLSDAIASDTQAFLELSEAEQAATDKYIVHTREVKTNTSALNPNADALQRITGASEGFAEQNKLVTEAVKNQTIAIGANTREWIANAIIQDEGLNNILEKYPNFFNDIEAMGVDFQGILEEVLANPDADVGAMIDKQFEGAASSVREQQRVIAAELAKLTEMDALGAEEQARKKELEGQQYILEQQVMKLAEARQVALDLAAAMGKAFDAQLISEMVNDILGIGPAFQDAGEDASDLNDEIKGISRTLRTVIDYGNDLMGIFNRVADIKFGTTRAEDDIADAWEKIAENAGNAAEKIEDANNAIAELTADRSVLEYQLSVAERYGDEKRAASIRAKLGKIDSDLADENQKLADAQDEASMTLEGNTQAARENRDAVDGLVGSYMELIQAAVESGMEGDELRGYIQELKDEFYENGEAVGYSREELDDYAKLFDDFAYAVEHVDPRIDIEFNTNIDAVQQALNEYEASLRGLDGYTAETTVEENTIKTTTLKIRDDVNGSDVRLFRMGYDRGLISYAQYMKALYGIAVSTGVGGGNLMLRSAGGPVFGPGTATSDSIPAMLSNGEYVIQASAVKSYGLDFMNALNSQRIPMTSSSSGAAISGNGGTTVAYLSPEDRSLLRAALDRPINLYADSQKIAQTANNGNTMIARRGAR